MQNEPAIAIFTFGGLEILIDGQPLRFNGRAPCRLLHLLGAIIARGGRSVAISTLADQLWPDADGFSAHQAFTVALHRLRRLLKVPGAVRLRGGQVSLDPAVCYVDLWEFERELRVSDSVQDLDELVLRLPGDFLGECDEPWALGARRRLTDLVDRTRRVLECRHRGTAVTVTVDPSCTRVPAGGDTDPTM